MIAGGSRVYNITSQDDAARVSAAGENQDRTGQDRTGQDRTRQERAGQKRAGKYKTGAGASTKRCGQAKQRGLFRHSKRLFSQKTK